MNIFQASFFYENFAERDNMLLNYPKGQLSNFTSRYCGKLLVVMLFKRRWKTYFNNFSLFSGAAKSFRHDSVLSPFPPAFLDDTGSKDIKGIHQLSDNKKVFMKKRRARKSAIFHVNFVDFLNICFTFDSPI